jgi:hypothetical protein
MNPNFPDGLSASSHLHIRNNGGRARTNKLAFILASAISKILYQLKLGECHRIVLLE